MATVVVQLAGPDFVQNAQNVAQKLQRGTVVELNVITGKLSPEAPPIKAAVQALKPYLTPNASIHFVTPLGWLGAGGGDSFGAGGSQTYVMNEVDYQKAQTILTQMQADNQKQQMQRWQIQQDAQTRIFQIQQGVTQNRAQTQVRSYKKWDEYIRG